MSTALLYDGLMPLQRDGTWLLPADTLGRFYLRAKPERTAAWDFVHENA